MTVSKSNSGLSSFKLENAVIVPVDRWRDWYDWFDENLKGQYYIEMGIDPWQNERRASVSFTDFRDAVLFKLYFG